MCFSQNPDQQQVYYPNNGNANNLQQLQAHHLAASSPSPQNNIINNNSSSQVYSPSGLNESASTLIQGPPILQSTLLADHQYQDNTINGINNYDRHSSNELYSNNNNHNHHHLQYDDSSIVGSATDL